MSERTHRPNIVFFHVDNLGAGEVSCYSGGPYVVDRISRGTIFVPDLFLNIVGGVQPEVARAIFGEGPEDGFDARFLSIWPDLPREWRAVDRWPNHAAREALDRVNDRLAVQDWRRVLEFEPGHAAARRLLAAAEAEQR